MSVSLVFIHAIGIPAVLALGYWLGQRDQSS